MEKPAAEGVGCARLLHSHELRLGPRRLQLLPLTQVGREGDHLRERGRCDGGG